MLYMSSSPPLAHCHPLYYGLRIYKYNWYGFIGPYKPQSCLSLGIKSILYNNYTCLYYHIANIVNLYYDPFVSIYRPVYFLNLLTKTFTSLPGTYSTYLWHTSTHTQSQYSVPFLHALPIILFTPYMLFAESLQLWLNFLMLSFHCYQLMTHKHVHRIMAIYYFSYIHT